MNRPLAEVAIDHALRNRVLAWWHAHLGVPAWAALLVLAAAALLQFQLRPSQERARATLLAQQQQLAQSALAGRNAALIGPDVSRDPLRQFVPEVAARGQDVGMLLSTATRSNLVVERADYTVEAVSGARLTRLHANLPVTGSYADVRKFIAETLNAMPNATLESLQLERSDTQAAQLQATLRIVLFYRAVR